jgi:hypothetical protein
MKIGVVSDTHRNKKLLQQVVDWFVKTHSIGMLYHLGDDYDDTMHIADSGVEIKQVPGIYHPGYRDGRIAPTVRDTLMGLSILLVHSLEQDVTSEDILGSDIVLYGHSHEAKITVEDGVLYMNPGHLKGKRDKNRDSSFGMLDIQEENIYAYLFDAHFNELTRVPISRSGAGLYKHI